MNLLGSGVFIIQRHHIKKALPRECGSGISLRRAAAAVPRSGATARAQLYFRMSVAAE